MRYLIVTATAAALAGAACAHGGSQGSSATAPPQSSEAMSQDTCPMTVPGTQVSAADTATGEVLTFTTTSPDQVPELRNRVRAMADMHKHHHGSAEEGTGSSAGDGTALSVPPVSTARAEDIDQGARITVTPTDASQLPELQRIAREHAALMQAQGRCDMAAVMEHTEMEPVQPGYTPGY